jgi:hypothetical protein
LLNLDAAVAGTEAPRFGLAFKSSIAVTELAATALQINTAGAPIVRETITESTARTPKAALSSPRPTAQIIQPMFRRRD